MIGQFLAWLLDGYVVGLVRACFYVTESMGQKNTLRFYRQEVWAKPLELAFRYALTQQTHIATHRATYRQPSQSVI